MGTRFDIFSVAGRKAETLCWNSSGEICNVQRNVQLRVRLHYVTKPWDVSHMVTV